MGVVQGGLLLVAALALLEIAVPPLALRSVVRPAFRQAVLASHVRRSGRDPVSILDAPPDDQRRD